MGQSRPEETAPRQPYDQDRIQVYRADQAGDMSEWRWRRLAPNGAVVGASTEGYRDRADALDNLLRNTGGLIRWEFWFSAAQGGLYGQGHLHRADDEEPLLVEVVP